METCARLPAIHFDFEVRQVQFHSHETKTLKTILTVPNHGNQPNMLFLSLMVPSLPPKLARLEVPLLD